MVARLTLYLYASCAGVSPLSERVVGELQGSHLVVRKDLPLAIASAFQIAHAQRRFL